MGILFHANDLPLTVLPPGTEPGPVQLQNTLHSSGFRSMITGHVRYAASFTGPCQCPYRKESACECGELVLLVYGENEPPLTLVLECRGIWTFVYLGQASICQANEKMKEKLISLLTSDDTPMIQ